jgi:hypothetical protein
MGKDEEDIYVEVGDMHSEKFDLIPKFEKDVPDIMSKAATKTLKASKGIKSQKPKGKEEKAYKIGGTLSKLVKKDKGNAAELSCEVEMVITDWHKGTLVSGRLLGKAKIGISADASEKDLRGDAAACVDGATAGAIKTAVEWITTDGRK